MVPIDISHDRVLIITNSSLNNVSAQSLCSNKWSKAKKIVIDGMSVLRVPNLCSIISKSFEISKIYKKENVKIESELGEILEVELHYIKKPSANQSKNEIVTPLPSLSNIVEMNNNKSTLDLNSIDVTSWSREKIMITSSSSLSLILVVVVIIITSIYCVKRCKTNARERNGDIVLNLNELRRGHESDLIDHNREFMNDTDNALTQNSKDSDKSAEKGILTEENAKQATKNQFKR